MIPIWQKVFADQLTPVTAYRCFVAEDDLCTPSFLLESVETGARTGRYSFLGASPVREVVAYAHDVSVTSYEGGRDADPAVTRFTADDPWQLIREMSEDFRPARTDDLPGGSQIFNGGWVGFGGYDTMRYAELDSLPFDDAPKDDRLLPDLHFGLYRDVVVFDHVVKVIYVVHWIDLEEGAWTSKTQSPSDKGALRTVSDEDALIAKHAKGMAHLNAVVDVIVRGQVLSTLGAGRVRINTEAAATTLCESNMTKDEFMSALSQIERHLRAGDTFQTVFSQRFERRSGSNPFNVYRALRIINPSPYMIYMQCERCVLVASSPEILTRVVDGVLTNRPLAGTRRRGVSEAEDDALAEDLANDGKDRSEHMMLVDLGRNDVGRVAEYGSVVAEKLMEVERYSHVMHLSSTVTGKLGEGLSPWDALRSTLPAGTISGAPKIRAMQIIDSLEPTKRGPYGGGIGYVSFYDTMNIALALRTIVVPSEGVLDYEAAEGGGNGKGEKRSWVYYLQAGAGIVFESDPESEYRETVNKAMALNRSIDLSEDAFGRG